MTTTHQPNRGEDLTAVDVATLHGRSGALLIDVREPEEWAAGHVAGSRHAPLSTFDPAAFDGSVPVVTICRSGGRSGRAADALAAAGVPVRNMAGGLQTWTQAGLPLVREDGTSGTLR